MIIERLNRIEEIEDIEMGFFHECGRHPLNISGWGVSKEFEAKMLGVLDIPDVEDWIGYQYTYCISDTVNSVVKYKLGLEVFSEDICPVYFMNNTIAIMNVANFLQKKGIKKQGIVNPAYFSVKQSASICRIESIDFSLFRAGGLWHIPVQEILSQGVQAIWITSPIFSTGEYYSDQNIHEIEYLLANNVMVIIDESFCLLGNELFPKLHPNANIVSIYSPHKAICINGLKFSVVLCSSVYRDFFEQWSDVLSGNLPPSSICAISHFLTENFDYCKASFLEFINPAKEYAIAHIHEYDNLQFSEISIGNLATLFITNIKASEISSANFTALLMRRTFAYFLPGFLHGFYGPLESCFRINFALDSKDFRAALIRILDFIRDFYVPQF